MAANFANFDASTVNNLLLGDLLPDDLLLDNLLQLIGRIDLASMQLALCPSSIIGLS